MEKDNTWSNKLQFISFSLGYVLSPLFTAVGNNDDGDDYHHKTTYNCTSYSTCIIGLCHCSGAKTKENFMCDLI